MAVNACESPKSHGDAHPEFSARALGLPTAGTRQKSTDERRCVAVDRDRAVDVEAVAGERDGTTREAEVCERLGRRHGRVLVAVVARERSLSSNQERRSTFPPAAMGRTLRRGGCGFHRPIGPAKRKMSGS
jgi:hypothetical protein